jgi:hypothetical protein
MAPPFRPHAVWSDWVIHARSSALTRVGLLGVSLQGEQTSQSASRIKSVAHWGRDRERALATALNIDSTRCVPAAAVKLFFVAAGELK